MCMFCVLLFPVIDPVSLGVEGLLVALGDKFWAIGSVVE